MALINFLAAAVMGLLLRAAWIWEINWMDYKHMLHGHSHVAMLGWVYLILYAFIVDRFVPPEKRRGRKYAVLFWATQITVAGMMFSFPVQGYGPVSIVFSALHILASYLFIALIAKDASAPSRQVLILLRSSLFFMFFSTLGLWAMGPLVSLSMQNDPMYFTAIQFYLHFQFNGWFVLAVLALVFEHFHTWGFDLGAFQFRRFFALYVAAVLLSFFQVLYWAYGSEVLFYINAVGVVLQFVAFAVLFWPVRRALFVAVRTRSRAVQWLFAFGMLSLLLKIGIQSGLVHPEVAEVSTMIRNFLVGYIHLITLGLISAFAFMLMADRSQGAVSLSGITLIALGIIGSEFLLFLQGLRYWNGWGILPSYHELLAAFSFLIPVGILVIIFFFMYKKDKRVLKSE